MIFNQRRNRERFMKVAYPHLDLVYNVALRLSGSSFDAEDLTQETFAAAFRKLHQLKDPERARFWLLSIVRNLYLRSREKNQPELLNVPDEASYAAIFNNLVGSDCPEKNYFNRATAQSIQTTLNNLPEKYQTPLILFYTEEWSYREISTGLDLPMGTVMSRIARGRDLMKKALLHEVRPRERGKVISGDFAQATCTGKG